MSDKCCGKEMDEYYSVFICNTCGKQKWKKFAMDYVKDLQKRINKPESK